MVGEVEGVEKETFITGAVNLLKRHSGIVWHPRRFAVLLRGKDARRSGNPSPPNYFRWGVQARLPQPHALWPKKVGRRPKKRCG